MRPSCCYRPSSSSSCEKREKSSLLCVAGHTVFITGAGQHCSHGSTLTTSSAHGGDGIDYWRSRRDSRAVKAWSGSPSATWWSQLGQLILDRSCSCSMPARTKEGLSPVFIIRTFPFCCSQTQAPFTGNYRYKSAPCCCYLYFLKRPRLSSCWLFSGGIGTHTMPFFLSLLLWQGKTQKSRCVLKTGEVHLKEEQQAQAASQQEDICGYKYWLDSRCN